MENISHALPKRSFASNPNGGFTSHKSVYDDVFGGPPKFGLSTLAPRLEDYSEIFGGFHASRSSSIPLLDIPLIGDDSELHFDGRSPGFNYAEVFGDCRGLDWTVSFDDVVGKSSGGYDSSDEPWSPAKSGSLSDELDPLAASHKSYRWSDEDSHRSLQNKRQLNVSYNRSGQRTMETVLAGASQVAKFGEDERCTMYVTDNVQYKKCLSNSNPLESGCYAHENDSNPSEKQERDTSSVDRPFKTITDINLQTKPSRVPPPSRPPPALAVKNGSNSKLKASKSYAFERVADTTPLFFDVEVDGTVYVDGMKAVHMKNAWSKGSLERVDTWDDSKWHLEDVMKEKEKMNKTVDSCSKFQGDKVLQSHGKETTSIGPVAWRAEKEYFEAIEKDISMESLEAVDHSNVSMQFQKPEAYRSLTTIESEASEENEDDKKFKVTKEASRWVEKRNQLEMAREDYEWGNKHRRERTETMLTDKKEYREKPMLEKLAPVYDVNAIMLDHDQQDGESGKPQIDVDVTKVNFKHNPLFEIDRRFTDAQTTKNSNVKPKKDIVRKEYQRRIENLGQAEIRERVKERVELEGTENQQSVDCWKENENNLEEPHMMKVDERTVKDDNKHGGSGKSCVAVVHDRKVDEQEQFLGDKDKEILMEVVTDKLNELTFTRAFEDLAMERGEERNEDAMLIEDEDSGVEKAESLQDMYLSGDDGMVQPSEEAKESEPIEMNERPVKLDSESNVPTEGDHSEVLDQAWNLENESATKFAGNGDNSQNLEKGQETVFCVGNMELKSQPNCSANESESGLVDSLAESKFNKFSKNKDELQRENTRIVTNNKAESLPLPEQLKDSNTGRIAGIVHEKIASPMGYSHEIDKNISTEDNKEQMMKRNQVIVEEVETRDSFTLCQAVNGSKVEDTSSVSECNKDQQYSSKNSLNQSVERKEKNQQYSSKNALNQSVVRKDQKVGDRIKRDIELENKHLRRIEEEREREREREKDRMAVDKAAFEAYEKSHFEAREKAERAAVERATIEVRQRAMAVARERLEKASMEARQRAERAAVERATAEARQRAIERSTTEKTAFERSVYDRFSVPSRSADTKQSFASSNIQFQDKGISSGFRHSVFPAYVEGESPQRCKARSERYRRTAERAANALAEKNKRDLLAQKEREERNRVAETLDAEVKRWSSGKEGNLRALLSTLQYILGPNSGWQPVPLTEVITSAAVKKAYRKATLCVHPDKLQQRGATIHQKYICEKVFDLLKEAWNKFNSEER